MSEERDYMICTSKDGSVCIGCEVDGALNCRYDAELVTCFRRTHFPFRAVQFLVTGAAAYFTGLWWTFILFVIVIALNFTVIESRYLCRHCPFYEKEGGTLECITLKGIPRIWKFDPKPMTRLGKAGMMAVGGFIDVFPLLISAYAVWHLFSAGADLLVIGLMAGLTILALITAGYLEKFLRENFCERCVNLSCMMNKVPYELKEKYLQKNLEWRKILEDCGYVLKNKSQ
ncbi:MAG: hypothetical protein ACFFF9_07000 [Candidatus Thorarchaeota archaeon]